MKYNANMSVFDKLSSDPTGQSEGDRAVKIIKVRINKEKKSQNPKLFDKKNSFWNK